MKFSNLLTLIALAASAAAWGQTSAEDHSAHHPAGASAPTPATAMADGEVRKVDKEQGKLTLRHGPITNLDMPGMTMVFKVADPKMLDALKAGDKVKFAAENLKGALTVTAIEAAQ